MKYLIPLLLLSTSALAQQQSGPCDTKEKHTKFLQNNMVKNHSLK